MPLIVRSPSDEAETISAPFSLLWLHELIADSLDLPDGEFPESQSESVRDTTPVVLADALTEHGHTIAAISKTTKVLTDGTEPDDIDTSRWWRINTADEGERTWIKDGDLNADLVDVLREQVTSHTDLKTLQGNIPESTKEQLAARSSWISIVLPRTYRLN